MSDDDKKRWRCNECNEISLEVDLLLAPNPFNPDEDTIVGCPLCLAVDRFGEICDEPGCESGASCGFPTKDGGYRRTCYKHKEAAK